MVTFSQRHGITPLTVPIQRESISLELRNGLWSLIHEIYWQRFPPPDSAYTIDPNRTENSSLKELFLALWYSCFKLPVDEIPAYYNEATSKVRQIFFDRPWFVPYEITEFIASHGPDSQKSTFIASVDKLLERENSAYRFVGEQIVEITSATDIESIKTALQNPLDPVRTHISASLSLLSEKKKPDYRNSIKEAISAVEATCCLIAGSKNATLTSALAKLPQIHPALAKSFSKLYGYTSDANGIRHALLDEPNLTYDDAKYMLVACSAFTNYLIVKAPKATEF